MRLLVALVALVACGGDERNVVLITPTVMPTPPTHSPISSPTLEFTSTLNASFEPTIGMLASVLIGRMTMEYWLKECKEGEYEPRKGSYQTSTTASCDARGANHAFCIEVWKRSWEEHWEISFIYFGKQANAKRVPFSV